MAHDQARRPTAPLERTNETGEDTTSAMLAIDILKWPGVSVPFLTSFIVSLILIFAVIPYGKRRPVGKSMTWGEAMISATYAFGVLLLAFGVVPNAWIDHADRDLGWSKDKILYGPGGILKPQSAGGWNPITLQYEALRDIVVVLIHVIYFGLLIYIWHWWQHRGDRPAAGTEIETSSYGRPLVKKG
jgi:hypothetical protein